MPGITAAQNLFKHQSGRVIALGRVMLVTLFLVAVLFDRSQQLRAIAGTYALLVVYAALAFVTATITWRNWWLDARLAVVTHGADMAVFTAIVFSTNGSTSPFFLFFVLPLLSAAIRWSWRETALTASALVALYLIAGLLVAGSQSFELERFVVRAGWLVVLSLLLIWFGIHQRSTRLFFGIEDFEGLGADEHNPLARALRPVMHLAQASAGALVVGPSGDEPSDGYLVAGDEQRSFGAQGPVVRNPTFSALLIDVQRNRALTRPPAGRFQFGQASAFVDRNLLGEIGLTQGLVAEVRNGTQHGWIVLWNIPDLSTDFIEVGRELGRAAGFLLDRYALVDAIEAGAAARTRLSLARDVHDSIVQFLAGTSFRIEAIKRAANSGSDITLELDEIKRLLVEEQGELRGFVLALRRGRDIELAESVAELRSLADRLSQQWSVDCSVTAEVESASVPIRLHLDLQQLIREAVANAVRHGEANRINVGLAVENETLQLSVADNGRGFPSTQGEPPLQPWSLKERVERANGTLRLVSKPGSTSVLISLPLSGAAA